MGGLLGEAQKNNALLPSDRVQGMRVIRAGPIAYVIGERQYAFRRPPVADDGASGERLRWLTYESNFNTFVLRGKVIPLNRPVQSPDFPLDPQISANLAVRWLLFAAAIECHGFPVAAVRMDAWLGFAYIFEDVEGERKGRAVFVEHGLPHHAVSSLPWPEFALHSV